MVRRDAVFRGIPVEVVPSRIREREPARFYYEIRHPDADWATPATVEEKVAVNCWGTLISPKKLDFGDDDYLEMTDAEMASLLIEDEDVEEAGA